MLILGKPLVGDGVSVGVILGVTEGVTLIVGVTDAVGVGVGVFDDVTVIVGVTDAVTLVVGVGVGVLGTCVPVGVFVGVLVGVCVGVLVTVEVGVGEGLAGGSPPQSIPNISSDRVLITPLSLIVTRALITKLSEPSKYTILSIDSDDAEAIISVDALANEAEPGPMELYSTVYVS
jgi:hypothetical protein